MELVIGKCGENVFINLVGKCQHDAVISLIEEHPEMEEIVLFKLPLVHTAKALSDCSSVTSVFFVTTKGRSRSDCLSTLEVFKEANIEVVQVGPGKIYKLITGGTEE